MKEIIGIFLLRHNNSIMNLLHLNAKKIVQVSQILQGKIKFKIMKESISDKLATTISST
jgi:hypothetical protein